MAGELGLDLYKIGLSTIVSKYIGETEKNLDRIFREAQNSNAILFFDEADVLFGKHSEVRDSHDRYANIEISYLLQKMEEYQGIVILATNFRKNIDEAFVRRLHFAVEFPFPEEEYRFQIWQRVFPAEAPLDETVDLPFLAHQFKAAGGNINPND
jgi:SpoVK/Ycf46/Vps4 family AAA+-type ATPase